MIIGTMTFTAAPGGVVITFIMGSTTVKSRAFSLTELSQLLNGGVFPPEKVDSVLRRVSIEAQATEENVEMTHALMHFLEFHRVP